ncbi:MAG: hypothetical protein M3458_08450 [Acidobacteriota bacterium]|nr:hypothetical protein [Acidobacteriota bacterium]
MLANKVAGHLNRAPLNGVSALRTCQTVLMMQDEDKEVTNPIFSPPVLLLLLAILVSFYHTGIGLYYALGLEPSPLFSFLYRAGLLCSVVWWLQGDSRKYKAPPVYCLGMLVSVAWMVVIPYHLFKTRGRKGLIVIVGLVIVFIFSQFLAVMTYMLLSTYLR